jgi:hypothetical protein
VPEGTGVAFRLKHGDSLEDLEAMPWIDVASAPPARTPVDLDAVLRAAGVDTNRFGHYVMVEATLASRDRHTRPTLYSFGISYSCALGVQ